MSLFFLTLAFIYPYSKKRRVPGVDPPLIHGLIDFPACVDTVRPLLMFDISPASIIFIHAITMLFNNRSYFSMFFNSLWQGICSTFRKFFRRKKSNAEIKKVDPNHFTTKKPETLQQVPESSTVLSQVQNPMHP